MRDFKKIYRKHKQQILPVVFVFAAFIVLFKIILPQWSDIQDALQLISTKQKIVDSKEATVQLLNSISTEIVDSDYQLVTTALPVQKDMILIFSELKDASDRSGVKLGGFSAKIGGVYATSKSNSSTDKAVNGVPFLNTIVGVTGDSNSMQLFAKEMYKSIPLLEIKSVDIGKTDARFDTNFYFKPVTLRSSSADTEALQSLTSIQKSQLAQLREWQMANR